MRNYHLPFAMKVMKACWVIVTLAILLKLLGGVDGTLDFIGQLVSWIMEVI